MNPEDVEIHGEELPIEKLEYFEVHKNTRGINWDFRIIGKDLFSNDDWIEKVKNIREKAELLCNIERVKEKVEELKIRELES